MKSQKMSKGRTKQKIIIKRDIFHTETGEIFVNIMQYRAVFN